MAAPGSPFPTLIDIVTATGRGERSCESVTRGLLEQIATREPVVKAWVHLDTEQAIRAARAIDASAAGAPLRGRAGRRQRRV